MEVDVMIYIPYVACAVYTHLSYAQSPELHDAAWSYIVAYGHEVGYHDVLL